MSKKQFWSAWSLKKIKRQAECRWFTGSQKYVTDAFGVSVDARTNVATKEETYETNVPGVFAAGDVRRGQSLVVWAIQEGKQAAKAVDYSLMGYTNL